MMMPELMMMNDDDDDDDVDTRRRLRPVCLQQEESIALEQHDSARQWVGSTSFV